MRHGKNNKKIWDILDMCGIFGIILEPSSIFPRNKLRTVFSNLLDSSESRGKEATGSCVKFLNKINILKLSRSPGVFKKTTGFKKLFKQISDPMYFSSGKQLILFGHSRLVTNGTQHKWDNNQPIQSKDLVCIHNGIIVNHLELEEKFPHINRTSELDTEVLLNLINIHIDEGNTLKTAVKKTFEEIEGAASVAFLHKTSEEAIIVTNTGSLYYTSSEKLGVLIFASEKRFIDSLFSKVRFIKQREELFIPVLNLKAGTGLLISPQKKELFEVPLSIPRKTNQKSDIFLFSPQKLPVLQQIKDNPSLKRCTKCILPHTMPFITFDKFGVCNYCNKYKSYETKPMENILKILDQHRKNDGAPDCVVAFSGGRDSSYGLHLLKKELGMNPLAVTYDWGMVTDLARRNQSRICSALGIEQILVSANIDRKRDNIKKNLEAWLRRPELGMIPLLMAGDKQFYYHSQKVAKDNAIDLIILCINPLEKTDFKSGFSGIRQKQNVIFNQLSLKQKINLATYYIKNFLLEQKYLNSSLFDTTAAFFISYFMKHAYTEIFDYFKWDEDLINSTLLSEYGWEIDPTTTTTWRIGDGTAPFYNYIYHHIAGFTENDTLRSNQIRENVISREQALQLVKKENAPRYEAIHTYLSLVNVDFERTMTKINSLPKLY